MSETPIVVKTCRSDLQSYRQLQLDLVAFQHKRVVVCVPDSDRCAFERILSPDFELVGTEQVLRKFGWPWQLAEDWRSQQLCKLLLVASSDHEACWVIDSNTLLMEPLPNPWMDTQVMLALGTAQPFDLCCFDSSARFLGLSTNGPSLDVVNQPLRASVVRALFEWISCGYRSPIEVLISSLHASGGRGAPLWTEYGLYRSFAFHLARSAHHYKDDSHRVAYYNHTRHRAQVREWLWSLKGNRPKMVKVYARRWDYQMETQELDRLCDQIRACR